MPESEPVHVDASPSSKMEVMREMDFLKKHKAAEPDRLSPSSFKDSGEVTT